MIMIPDRVKRGVLLGSTSVLPKPLRVRARFMGLSSQLAAQTERADVVLITHPKSGSTWLRAMVSRLYDARYGYDSRRVVKSDELCRHDRSLPRFAVTNGHYTYEGVVRALYQNDPIDAGLRRKKFVLLARNPGDIAVSWYLQFTKRTSAHKKELINAWLSQPLVDADTTMWDFVMHDELGLPALIDFFNGWECIIDRLDNALILHYEDLRTRPAEALTELMTYLDAPFTREEIDDAAAYGSFENLSALERQGHFRGKAMSPSNPSDPDTYKVRRGKIGGYRDYFDAAQVAQMEEMVATRLSPRFGYGRGAGQDLRTSNV